MGNGNSVAVDQLSYFTILLLFHNLNVVLIVEGQLSAWPQTVDLAQCLGAGFVSGCPADGLVSP